MIKYCSHRNGNESPFQNIQRFETVGKPLQCWECGGNHLCMNFLHRDGGVRQDHNIQGAETEIGIADHEGLCKQVLGIIGVCNENPISSE